MMQAGWVGLLGGIDSRWSASGLHPARMHGTLLACIQAGQMEQNKPKPAYPRCLGR